MQEEADTPGSPKHHILTPQDTGQAFHQAMHQGGTREGAGQSDDQGRTPESQGGWRALQCMPGPSTRGEEDAAARGRQSEVSFVPCPTPSAAPSSPT